MTTTEYWQVETFVSTGPGNPGTWRPYTMMDLRALPGDGRSMLFVNALRSYSERPELGGRACILKEHVMELLRRHRAHLPGIPARAVRISITREVQVF